jgi:hypothetical protein
MNLFRIIFACCLVIAVIMVPAIAAEQAPMMPHVFFGTVYVGNQAAPAGVTVEATGTGVHTGTTGNPVSTKADGTFAGPGSFDQKLIIQGEITNGVQITFYVNGEKAQCRISGTTGAWLDTYPFKSAEQTNLDLKVATLPTGTPAITPTSEVTSTTITPTRTYVSSSGGGGGGGGGGGSYAGSFTSEFASTTGTTKITTVATTAKSPDGNFVATSGQITNPVTKVPITGSPTKQPGEANTQTTPVPASPGSSQLPTIIGIIVILGIIAGISVIVVLKRKGHM